MFALSCAGRGVAIGQSPSKESLKLFIGLIVSKANSEKGKARVPNRQEREERSDRSMIRLEAE